MQTKLWRVYNQAGVQEVQQELQQEWLRAKGDDLIEVTLLILY
jgi:hypothetical protein